MVKAGKSEEEIASSEVKSDVEVLEIENPKEVDAQPSEIEGLKLDDDVKKTLASSDVENKNASKDKEKLLKEDDDVCEEVKEIYFSIFFEHKKHRKIWIYSNSQVSC